MIQQYWNRVKHQLAALQLPKFQNRFEFAQGAKAFESFAVLCCFDQHLVLTSISANHSMMVVDDCLSIDLPTHLIGDSGVENPSEVSQIVLDLMDVMGLSSSPVLLLLSSSKFSHCSFPVDQISAWDLSDIKLQVKSPFLPDETLIDLYPDDHSLGDDQSMRGVSYANSRLVHSWSDVLRIVGQPVLGISPLYGGLLNWLFASSKSLKNTVICDVEPNCCNLLIKYSLFGSQSFQLPFGTSLYADQSGRLLDQFFKRLQSSLEVIQEDQGLDKKMSYIISGYGLGDFGTSLMPNLGLWSLLGDFAKVKLQISANLKPDELSRHQHLFPQLSLGLAAYLQS